MKLIVLVRTQTAPKSMPAGCMRHKVVFSEPDAQFPPSVGFPDCHQHALYPTVVQTAGEKEESSAQSEAAVHSLSLSSLIQSGFHFQS
jgi:hypothetical protein